MAGKAFCQGGGSSPFQGCVNVEEVRKVLQVPGRSHAPLFEAGQRSIAQHLALLQQALCLQQGQCSNHLQEPSTDQSSAFALGPPRCCPWQAVIVRVPVLVAG